MFGTACVVGDGVVGVEVEDVVLVGGEQVHVKYQDWVVGSCGGQLPEEDDSDLTLLGYKNFFTVTVNKKFISGLYILCFFHSVVY